MGLAKTYDKASWHFPEGKGCPSLEAAKIHFRVITKWLRDNDLLSTEGIEAAESGIDADFALTAHMLTPKGNRVLGRCYGQWVRSVRYGEEPKTELLERCLASDS